ncbi:MAG: hypothetical protein ACOX2G_10275 [Bacillota bacterium]|jgi:hypothetical protein
MKKGLALVLSLCMLVAVFSVTGCSPAESTVKLGLGSVSSIASSKDATETTTALGQADTTVAAVVFDKNGKIVDVRIDTVQTKVNFDADMKVTNRSAAIKSKKELGHDYNMAGRSEIGKEWFEQIAALEEWMIGKTVEEVTSLKVKERDASHKHVPDVPELTSTVTITVESYLAAVAKAWENTIEVKGYDTLGLGIDVSIASSRDASETTTAQAQADATFAATAFDKDGKVAGVIIDTAQVRIAFDADGKVTSDKTAELKTKKELGYDYNMKDRSEIGKEWFEQIEALEDWMKGKAVGEIVTLKVKERDANHKHVPDVPELTSSVTITVEHYLAAVQEAYRYKK